MGDSPLDLIGDDRRVVDKPFSFFQEMRDQRIEKRNHYRDEGDINECDDDRKRRTCPEKFPDNPVGHMIAELHHLEAYSLCHIEEEIGKKKGDQKDSEKRLEKIDPGKEKRYREELLEEIPVEDEFEEERETHSRNYQL